MIILIAWSEHKFFYRPGNSDDRDDPETYYLNESKAYKEPCSDTCRSLVVGVKTKSCVGKLIHFIHVKFKKQCFS